MSMRSHFIVCLFVAVLAGGCATKPNQREYVLQGQVLSVADDRQQAIINHEAITGFMGAMTMPYKVHDPEQLEGIVPGDLINAKLVV